MRGRVVVVDFWTYTCVNWLRTLPYLRAWAAKYHDDGLTVIGVHTPEFDFEGNVENVIEQSRALGVEYPVAVDTDYAVWSAFANHFWPALYIADREGRIRFHHFGEGEYPMTEMVIQQLLFAGATEPITVSSWSSLTASNWRPTGRRWPHRRRTSATGQSTGFAQEDRGSFDTPIAYTVPDRLRRNEWALSGTWTVAGHAAISERARGTDRLSVPCARRQPRDGTRFTRDVDPVPGVPRRATRNPGPRH